MKSKRFEVKEGNISIPIYEFSDGRFCVDSVIAGKRKRITRASIDVAKLEARRLLALVAGGRSTEQPLSISEAEDYRLAKGKLMPFGVSLMSVVDDWIHHYHRNKAVVEKKVPEIVSEFLETKKADGVSQFHLSDRQSRLRKFAAAFSSRIDRITTAEIEQWLGTLGGSRRTKKNYRDAVTQLFRFARSRRYLPKNERTAAEEVIVPLSREGEIEIYSPDELRLLLRNAPDQLLPFFVLGAFAGLRSQEIMRLEWREIHIEEGFIEISAAKAKTASRRLVPLLPVAKAWLTWIGKKGGRVMEYAHNAALWRARAQFCQTGIKDGGKTVSFDWKSNALRHSYASYRLAEIKDAARVALEMGNSPSMLFRNYRELVTEAAAKQWFGSGPAVKDSKPTGGRRSAESGVKRIATTAKK